MSERAPGLTVAMTALAAASWGTWSLFLRPTGLPATVTTPIMFAAMGLATLPLALREPRPRWDRGTAWLLVGNVACDVGNVLAFFAAIRLTTVAIAVITHYLAPILIALAAPRIDATATGTTRSTRLAAAVAFVGLAIVLEPWRATGGDALAGALFGLVSAVAYAGNVFVARRLAMQIGVARSITYHSLIGAVVMVPIAVVAGLVAVTAGSVALVAAGGVTIGALSGLVYVTGLTRIGAARAGVLAFAEPLVAVAVGVLAWHEPLRPIAAAGGVLVIAAGVHVARQAR